MQQGISQTQNTRSTGMATVTQTASTPSPTGSNMVTAQSTASASQSQLVNNSVQIRRRSPPPQTAITAKVEQKRRRSPPLQTASTTTTSRKISTHQSRSAYIRPFGREGSTAIAGYNTTKWGAADRQQAAKQSPQKLAEYDDEVSDHIAQVGSDVCPHQWRWYPVKLRYLCGGTTHLLSYEEAQASMRGERPNGPFVEHVNVVPNPNTNFRRSRVITPPPGHGDGNFMREGIPKNAAGWYYNGYEFQKEKPEDWPFE